MNNKYQKIERPKEAVNDKMLVLLKDNSMLYLDAISLYIWENCTEHTLQEITKSLILACDDSNQLCFEEVQEDCRKVIAYLAESGLIGQEGWDN